MRSWLPLLSFLALSGLSACTTKDDVPTQVDAPNTDAGEDAHAPLSEGCVAVRDAVQDAVESARASAKTSDVAVGLITRGCPFVPVVAGASAIPVDARFRFGSITKTYTAAVILHFVEKGALRLDEPVARFTLGVPNEAQITVRQLLNHTSGLFNYTEDKDFPKHLDWTPQQRLQAAASHPVYFAPGEGWKYSNTNFVALGLIAEQLGGASIQALIRSIVLEPHALASTYFAGAEEATGAMAPSFKRGQVPTDPASVDGSAWADGAIVATLEDETRWMRLYASGEATPASTADLFAAVDTTSPAFRYGLALEEISAAASGGNGPSFGHGGDIPGFHSMSYYFPERSWTITVVVNSDTGDPNGVFLAVMDALSAAKE